MSYLKTAPKRYFLEVMAALILMFGITVLVGFLVHSAVNPVLVRITRVLLLLPIAIMGLAVLRFYRGRDELQQQLMLKTTAAAGLVALLVMMAYATLIPLGLPRFSLMIGILILASSYVLAGTVFAFRQKSATSGPRQAFIQLAPMIVMPLVPAAYWALSLFVPLPPLSFQLGMLLFCAGAVLFGFWQIFLRSCES